MERLLSRKEAAELLGISISTLDTAKRTGAISFIQFVDNGKVFFTESGIAEYIYKSTHNSIPKKQNNKDTYRKKRT